MATTYKELVKNFYSHLNDDNLLLRLDSQILTEQTVRIILLDSADNIIYENGEAQTIEGEVTQGSVSVNGKSSIRRTGSLTLVATDENCKILNPENKISIKTRFALEVGITDMITGRVYYFPLGVFCATGASIQRNLSGYTISLSFKDKMVLLNGELGGSFPAAVDLHQETLPDGTVQKVAIVTTVIQMIRDYSDVVLSNVIMKNAADEGVQVSGLADTTFATTYLTADNIEFDAVVESEVSWIGKGYVYKLSGEKDGKRQIELFTDLDKAVTAQAAWVNPTLTAHGYGAPIGYQKTLFTFPGELTANSGDNVASILEKIKNTVATNHEFYFDVLGDFHFEKMKHNLFGEKDEAGNKKEYVPIYTFDQDSPLISSYQNNPNYAALKNDFVIWGERTTASGVTQAIMYHQVFDAPPALTAKVKVVAYKDNELSTGHKWRIDKASGTEVTAQHYMEQLYLEGLSNSEGPARAYFAELHGFIGNLVDLTADDETRKEQWDALEAGGKTETNYWLEFVDVSTSNIPGIRNLDVDVIGRRTLPKNEKAVNCIAETPVDNIYISRNGEGPADETIIVLQVDDKIGSALVLGAVQYSAEEYLRGILHNHISYCETISVTSLPIYHLEPNCCIKVEDEETSISGKYILNSYSIPLDISGTMSLSCSRALEMLTAEEEETQ